MKRFSSFTVDTSNQCLWRGQERLPLTPKAFALLSYLVHHPGRLVTKDELLEAVWPNTFIQEAVLKVNVLEIRRALGDDSSNPKYIATEHRRGYRFLDVVSERLSDPLQPPLGFGLLLGRERELKFMRELLGRALGGERKLLFVSGEPGIGKSTLINRFLQCVRNSSCSRIASSQCVEQLGTQEAYYPVFDALTSAFRSGVIPNLPSLLRKCAPTLLVNMPSIQSAKDLQSARREAMGATRERLLRETCDAVEAIATEGPIVLVFEDLHWSDVSTIDLLSGLSSRSAAARLLVVGSYRPAEATLLNQAFQSLKQSWLARGTCSEIALEPFSRGDVVEYLEHRFPKHTIDDEFASVLHERSGGNPLFLANVIDYAVSRSLIEDTGDAWRLTSEADDLTIHVPDTLSKMIGAQIERLTPAEQNLLQMGSVAGMHFSAAHFAPCESEDAMAFEKSCESLARRSLFIRQADLIELSGARFSAGFQFTHSLYRDVFFKRLSPVQRIRLHRMAGERMEQCFDHRLDDLAGALALHFSESRDYEKAIAYLRRMARRSVRRHALAEAINALEKALVLTGKLPESQAAKREIELYEEIGLICRLMGRFDLAAVKFVHMSERASQSGVTAAELRAQLLLASAYSWLDRSRCMRAVDRAAELCLAQPDEAQQATARGQIVYWNLLFRGWRHQDAIASERALDAARGSENQALIAVHATRHAFFQALASLSGGKHHGGRRCPRCARDRKPI